MRILVTEDDFASRKFMAHFLSKYGETDITVDGFEALDAFKMAHESGVPYDLICLDIMMPGMDGYEVLKSIRDYEKKVNLSQEYQAKVIMTTALSEGRYVNKAFDLGCVAYAGKPIDTQKFENVLKKLKLV